MWRQACCVLFLGGLWLFAPFAVFAAGEGNQEFRLDPIVVTATRTERRASEVPEAVDVIDAEAIEREQATDVGDLLENLPGVELEGGPRRISEEINIRGLSDERVLVTIDGARQNFDSGHKGQLFIDPEVLKRVEVVKGPASAVWGSGALGGVVAFTTKDAADLLEPGRNFGASVKTGFQSVDDHFTESASLFGRITDDLEFLLFGTYRNADDLDLGGDAGTLKNSQSESWSGLGKLTWRLGEHHTLRLSGEKFEENEDVPTNPSVAVSTALVDRKTERFSGILNYRYSNPANRWLDVALTVYRNDLDINEPRIDIVRNDVTTFETTGFNLRNSTLIDGPLSLGHRLTYGVDYYLDDAEGIRDGAPRLLFPNGEQKVLGFYLQDEITLTERWSLIPAVRRDNYDSEPEGTGLPDTEDEDTSVKIGTVFKLTDGLSVHASYNEAFRAPNLPDLFVTGAHFPGAVFEPNPALRPETAKNKEVGFRFNRAGVFQAEDNVHLDATYFRNDVEDFISFKVTFTPPGGPLVFKPENLSSAEFRGMEVEAGYDSRYFFANAGYSRVRGSNAATGAAIDDAPPDKLVLNLGGKMPSRDLLFGTRVTLVAKQDRVATATVTGGHGTADLYLTWDPQHGRLKGLHLGLGLDNLTDKQYRRHLATIPEAGRNFKTTLSYKF